MRFYSSSLAAILTLALSACSLKHDENERKFIEPLRVASASSPIFSGEEGLAPVLFEPAAQYSPCEVLESIPVGESVTDRFRLLGEIKFDKEDASPLSEIPGRVDVGASPLYQYAILTQQIPTAEEFMALLEGEYERATGFGDVLKLGIARRLLKWGFMNVYSLRNSVVQDRINEALPGVFKESGEAPLFKNSVPAALLQNGNPFLVRMSLSPEDNQVTRETKLRRLDEVFKAYNRPLRVFSPGGWPQFSQDMKVSLTAAIRGLNSSNIQSRACSTVLMHRAFAQLMAVMGYHRPPIEEERRLSFFPPFQNMLKSKEDNELVVCPSPGSFLQGPHRLLLTREQLGNGGEAFDLAQDPQTAQLCSRQEAKPLSHAPRVWSAADAARASGSQVAAFLNGAVNFAFAFNPRSQWWRGTQVGFPLSPFDGIEKIKSSGAILPADAHALSLGFVNLGFDLLMKKHLVFVNDAQKEVPSSAEATGVRLSEASRTAMSGGKVITTVAGSAQLMEIAFKLGHSLGLLDRWRVEAEESIREELAFERDPVKRRALKADFNMFLEGMFGSADTLERLGSGEKGSVRDQLRSLSLASSLLGARFVVRENGRVTCASRLVLDLASGVETPEGRCTASEEAAWKYSLLLAARTFRSPYFFELSR